MSQTNNNGGGTPSPQAVNLDALSAPEGGYDPIIHGQTNIQPDEDDPTGAAPDLSGLPNLDPTGGDLAGDPDPNADPNADPSGTGNSDPNADPANPANPDPANPANPDPNNPDPAATQYWMKPFEQLKAANPNWEIPKDITEENYLAVLQSVLKPQPKVHPDLMKMQEALDAGVPMNQVMDQIKKTSDFNAMTDRELMTANYKQTFKDWDDKKIKETVDKLEGSGLLEVEAGRLRTAINQQNAQKFDAMKQVQIKQDQEAAAKTNAERAKQITESLAIINKADNVYGLPVSQAEKAEFAQYFSQLVTPDATGSAPMFQMLQSNENLVKVALMLWKGDAKVRAALTDAKESGKNSALKKLDPKPNTPAKGAAAGDPNKVDLDALAAPERIRW